MPLYSVNYKHLLSKYSMSNIIRKKSEKWGKQDLQQSVFTEQVFINIQNPGVK